MYQVEPFEYYCIEFSLKNGCSPAIHHSFHESYRPSESVREYASFAT